MSPFSNAFDVALNLSFFFFGVAIIVSFIRLVLGPLIPDRVISLEIIAVLVIGAIMLYAMATHQWVLLDIAIIVALISFLGAVAFAFFVEKRGAP